MADGSRIEWTEATWNPLRGCSRVSEGCRNCYAERTAARFDKPGMPYEGLIHRATKGWNGKVRFVPEVLDQPLRWKRPRKIFVNSMSDLFHENVPFEQIAAIFGVMSAARHHTFQVLTKRPERALAFFAWLEQQTEPKARWVESVAEAEQACGQAAGTRAAHTHPVQCVAIDHFAEAQGVRTDGFYLQWPLPNVWLGVSVENQATADERIPQLLQMPAAVRWLSCEPLLGPINFRWVPYAWQATGRTYREYLEAKGSVNQHEALRKIDWVVVGGESGPNARAMHPEWARTLRDQCAAAKVPYLFKQWGEWLPVDTPSDEECFADDGSERQFGGRLTIGRCGTQPVARVGKKRAGRLLDGALHDAYPEVSRA